MRMKIILPFCHCWSLKLSGTNMRSICFHLFLLSKLQEVLKRAFHHPKFFHLQF